MCTYSRPERAIYVSNNRVCYIAGLERGVVVGRNLSDKAVTVPGHCSPAMHVFDVHKYEREELSSE